MNREKLRYLIAVFAIFVMMSMTITDASKDKRFRVDNGVILSVPAKPIATVYVRGTDEMYRYIKKVYQVQTVEAGGSNNVEYHMFLRNQQNKKLVKY